MKPLTPDLAGAGVTRRELNFILAVDCSGSMTGEKMASLNYAMRSTLPAMREAARDNPETRVLIRVVSFSTGAAWQTTAAVPVEDYAWTDLEAGGETATGAALREVAAMLTPEVLAARQLPPIIVLISDGQPTDDFEAGLDALRHAPFGAKSVRIAIAIGGDADLDTLKTFVGNDAFAPLQANTAEELVNRIKWATTTPVKAVSRPSVGQSAADTLVMQSAHPHAAATLQGEDNSMVW